MPRSVARAPRSLKRPAVQHGESDEFGGGGDKQVWNRRCAVPTPVGEQHLDFQGAVFDCRGEVFDRHCGQRRSAEVATRV